MRRFNKSYYGLGLVVVILLFALSFYLKRNSFVKAVDDKLERSDQIESIVEEKSRTKHLGNQLENGATNFDLPDITIDNQSNNRFYSIKKFVDGDTFWIDDGTEDGIKIRFIGIDAPESRKIFNKEEGYFGKEAKYYVERLLTGKKVRLEYDVDPLDQYGRTLAYIFMEDGTFLNAKLVEEGYAVVMTVPPNVKYVDLFIKLQKQARENNRGLWNR